MNNQNFLLQVEGYAEDAFRVKRSYVDVAGDLVAGILLGQIVFWHLPNQHGQSKLRVRKGNQMWLAKSRTDWWDEIRITPKQYDRAIKILVNKGFVETKLFKFDGAPSVHIRLDFDLLVNSIFTFGENPNSPLGKMNVDEKGKSLTEITTEITTDSVVGDAVSNDLNIYKHYEKTWGIAPNASLLSMQKYQQLGFEDALIIECMEIAVKKGKRWTYAAGILDNLEHQHNVFTLEAYKALSHPPRTRSTESGTPTKNSKADFFNELAASLKEDHENDE